MEAKDKRTELENRFRVLSALAFETLGFTSVITEDRIANTSEADLKAEVNFLLTLLRTPR